MSRAPKTPAYCFHRASNQAYVHLDGRDHYLGKYNSPESRAEYDRLIALWLSNGRALPKSQPVVDTTVDEILHAYWTWAQTYYRKNDPDIGLAQTPQVARVRRAIGSVRILYGSSPAVEFGPVQLRAVRQKFVGEKLARTHVNQLVGVIKHCFRWAASHAMVPASVCEGLRTLEGLKRGRCEAEDREPVKPVPEADIPPVKAIVLPVVRDLIDLQLLTACRPGELVDLRPAELDRSGDVWVYRPRQHKTLHHGHDRPIWFGPKAQTILWPYLFSPVIRDPEVLAAVITAVLDGVQLHSGITLRLGTAWCFSPKEAMLTSLKEQGRKAKTLAKDRYSVSAYVRAIRRGCDHAGVERFRPHRLRHNAATRLVAEFGWDVARILLGHATLNATRVYAENNEQKAIEAMKKVG